MTGANSDGAAESGKPSDPLKTNEQFKPNFELLESIPREFRIKVIQFDSSVVVISKPGHLRSVPGHARNSYSLDRDPTQSTGPRKRRREEDEPQTLSGQQSWVASIESFRHDQISDEGEKVKKYITRLASNKALVASTPRKYKVFCRYIHRNRERILQNDAYSEEVARDIYNCIQERQRAFLPEPTKPGDSALGQLTLLGFRRTDDTLDSGQDVYIVHRLDCETSGVMIFARTQSAASTLSHAWRQRDVVKKTYVAHVRCWPPYQQEGLLSGSIDLPLRPSDERLKWETCLDTDDGAKPCTTLWKVISGAPDKGPVILELTPVTGRTHQLRIHCLAVGKGIIGDTLYGDGSQCGTEGADQVMTSAPTGLRLHAFQLVFPHPETGNTVECAADPPPWYTHNKEQ